MSLLQVSGLTVYNKGAVVLNEVRFAYTTFRRLAIAGETGSGKTTLLKAIAGLVQPTEGAVYFEAEKVPGPEEKLLPGHPRIAYLSQHFELRNNYNVDDFLEMASKIGEGEARRIYDLCQISHLLHRRTDQLSGGERQRTALARLLTTSPKLLLLDEPYSNLDGIHKQQLKNVINDIVEEGNTRCIMVSHDPTDVLPWAEEILVLRGGRLVQQDKPENVYAMPVDTYVGGLFGDYNLLPASAAKALFKLNGQPDAGAVFFRPEDVQLATQSSLPNGIVTSVVYFGSFYEVMVQMDGASVLVKTHRPGVTKGDAVAVSIKQECVWNVPH